MEVAAALLDASRKLSDKEKREASTSTGNISMGSCSSWASHTEVRVYCLLSIDNVLLLQLSDKTPGATVSVSPTSWLANPWSAGGERKRSVQLSVSFISTSSYISLCL